jgi:hypothetical protein
LQPNTRDESWDDVKLTLAAGTGASGSGLPSWNDVKLTLVAEASRDFGPGFFFIIPP